MIIDTIQEWFKEVLIDGIISNLSGTFDTVNTKVSWTRQEPPFPKSSPHFISR